uniref:Uncharacterized protein n=1 Tax=Oryza nivara TaxID=4536 RepID=A0A0E0HRF8_ORYNI
MKRTPKDCRRLQRWATASPDLVSPLGRGDRRRARSTPAQLRGPGRGVASGGDGGGCGGDEVGDDGGGLRRGITGESLAEPFGRLTMATPFGVVPLLGGVRTPFLSLPYSLGENLASVPNERWRRSMSHPPWGHRFGETSSCKDIIIGLYIGFELQS